MFGWWGTKLSDTLLMGGTMSTDLLNCFKLDVNFVCCDLSYPYTYQALSRSVTRYINLLSVLV